MNDDRQFSIAKLDERTRKALHELQRTIAARYPSATFEIVPSPEDPASIHLLATADVDDPDEVGDLVVERVVSFIEDGVRVHVIPLPTPERIQASLEVERRSRPRYGSLAS